MPENKSSYQTTRNYDLTNQIDENKVQIESITKELKEINIESDNLLKSNQDFEKVLSRIELLNSLIQQIKIRQFN
ncbi:hypothetical protein B5S33_g5449 [[Candida] boidinii]|nr:hypothetical protein B5S27_g5498 [[Candida] boidinii]OWB68781.1 hypothetical protein B5S30_g4170 [[Candida] boidinii]OWB86738.1 hypothetical protein B5S33_g5449 [[Candida] boidinii]